MPQAVAATGNAQLRRAAARTFLLALALPLTAVADESPRHIGQKHKTFSKPNITIKVGETLVYDNEDDVTHNITVRGEPDGTKDLGLQKPGTPVEHQYNVPGNFVVVCNIHPRMRQTVTVEPK